MSEPSARAELLADAGEAARSDQFFRSPEFLAAEGVTHTLRIERGETVLLAPLIVREIPATPLRDAISPYGYPGLLPPPARLDPAPAGGAGAGAPGQDRARDPLQPGEVDLSATGLVSVFLRHALGPPPLAATTERNTVLLADPALAPKSRPSDRRQVRRNREAGYRLRLVPGPQTSAAERAGFLDLYEQTMRRTGASESYFFGPEYFDAILAAAGTWLALATAPGGELAAASVAALSDGYLHYYLSGSADARLREAPMKNVVTLLVEHAAALGLPLNLGGGLRRGDALEEFKRGFANREVGWHSSELVCDPAAYDRLSAGREAGGFFPAYRAP